MLKEDAMIRGIRLKLTILNAVIMVILLALFVTSTYFLMRYEIFNQSQQVIDNIASNVVSGTDNKLFHYDSSKYFYLKINSQGNMIKTSAIPPEEQKHLAQFVQRIVRKGAATGILDWYDRTYTFKKVPLPGETGFVLIIANVEREIELLGFLLGALFLAGMIFMALALYSSLFLADRALIPIKRSWQRQRDFVADASHELRTPLAVIQTNLELVMGNPRETVEEQQIWLENISLEVQHITKLVEDLLFLARVDSEQQLLEMRTFQLDQAINDVAKPLLPVAAARHISITLDLETGIEFYGDEKRIKQLVLILLDNALKHTPEGGEIGLKLKNNGAGVEIAVWDTGIGIDDKHMDKIFERFYQVDNARSKTTTGAGLGLSIADWIVKGHLGSIKVKSTPGRGTTFLVTLKNA